MQFASFACCVLPMCVDAGCVLRITCAAVMVLPSSAFSAFCESLLLAAAGHGSRAAYWRPYDDAACVRRVCAVDGAAIAAAAAR